MAGQRPPVLSDSETTTAMQTQDTKSKVRRLTVPSTEVNALGFYCSTSYFSCFLLSSLDKLEFLCNVTRVQGEPLTPYTKTRILNSFGFEAL